MGLETDWGGELALGPSPPLFCISGGLTCVGCFWGARVSLLLPGLGQQEAPAGIGGQEERESGVFLLLYLRQHF